MAGKPRARRIPGKPYFQKIKQRYGLTRDAYIALRDAQDGRCAICRRYQVLAVDHNHTTGKVRGLLCRRCNNAIGLFLDKPLLLRSALRYLRRDE